MRRRASRDPYALVIDSFNRRGVRYVVVGMSGINYYAKSLKETFSTLDYDFFLEPSLKNVENAIQGLKDLDFHLGAGEETLKPEDLKVALHDQKTIVATREDGVMVELLLKVSGYPFSELAKDAATFTIDGIPVRVGRLTKLLRSKRLADRPKDRHFLKRYESLLEEE